MHQRGISLLEEAASSDQDGKARLWLANAYRRFSTYEIPGDPNNLAEREAMAFKGYEICEQLHAEYPDRHDPLRALCRFCRRLGDLKRERGNLPEAERWYRKEVEYSRQRAARFPSRPGAHGVLADSFSELAQTLEAQKKWPEAEALYRDAMALMEREEFQNPNERDAKDHLIEVYEGLSNVLLANGQTGHEREIQELDIKRARLEVAIDEQFGEGETE